MIQKFSVGFCTFSYGGNGGIASEHPDIREWMTPLIVKLSQDERISHIHMWNISDTPVTMSRNQSVLDARARGCDVLVMVDSDMKPDSMLGHDPDAKPFFEQAFDFLAKHYPKGPCVIGAPYCGPPPAECVYVFRWQAMQSNHPNPDFQLEMYDRHTAAKMSGVQECAALPTGLIMYDMRAFELTEPKKEGDKPWFFYEFVDLHQSKKASTEDVTNTRDISLVGIQKLGYNPVHCAWSSWASHWKPKAVPKPQFIDAKHISQKMKESFTANVDSDVKIVNLTASQDLLRQLDKPAGFDPMGMDLPEADAEALRDMIKRHNNIFGTMPYVCEVGSWAGRSAIIMSEAGARPVMCIDTWEGSKNDKGCQAYDGSRGTPLEVFKRNTAKYDIGYAQAESPKAAEMWPDKKFDIVYIDAEHDYESVMADIKAWKPKAKHWIAGHDYHSFPDVQRAVKDSGLVPTVEGNVWIASV